MRVWLKRIGNRLQPYFMRVRISSLSLLGGWCNLGACETCNLRIGVRIPCCPLTWDASGGMHLEKGLIALQVYFITWTGRLELEQVRSNISPGVGYPAD